jgi:hypothetical protein
MHSYDMFPDRENWPTSLSDEQKQDPYGVLDDFFSCFHVQDVRELLWDWLVAALSAESGAYGSGYERSNLIFVYERIEYLIEAAYGLHRRRKKSIKRKQKLRIRR